MALLLTYLFLSGSGSTASLDYIVDSMEAVKTFVVNNERQTEAVNILKSMKKRSKENSKKIGKTGKELDRLIGSRDASTAEISAIGDRDLEIVQSHNSDMLDLRFELREQVNRDEWSQIFSEQ
jgi:hypothetical protein